MNEELIIWLDDKSSLTRKYEDFTDRHGRVTWQLSAVTNYGTHSLTISGFIFRYRIDIIHSKALSAAKDVYEGKSFNYEEYFDPTDAFKFEWNAKNNKFKKRISYQWHTYSSITFPLDGAKALVEDMTIVLKELKWIDS